MDQPNIYVITTIEKLEEDDKHFVITGDTRPVGFYYNFNDADLIVRSNSGDIWETVYDYALIEEVEPGLYPYCHNRWLYKYDMTSDSYNIENEPEFMSNIVNFSIG